VGAELCVLQLRSPRFLATTPLPLLPCHNPLPCYNLPLHSSSLQLRSPCSPCYNSALLATTLFLATQLRSPCYYTLATLSLLPHPGYPLLSTTPLSLLLHSSLLQLRSPCYYTLPCYDLPPHPSLLQLATTLFLAATCHYTLPCYSLLLHSGHPLLATTLLLATTPLSLLLHPCYPLLATTPLSLPQLHHALATLSLLRLRSPRHHPLVVVRSCL